MFNFLLHHLFSFKRALVGIGVISLGGAAIHYGVSKPVLKNRRYELLNGSAPLLHKNKSGFNSLSSSDFYYVDEFDGKKQLPDLFPALTVSHLNKATRNEYKNEFTKEIQKSLNVDIETINNNDKGKLKDGYLLKVLEGMNWKARELAVASDIEIPYKSILLINKVNELDKDKIIQDILWSLAEESAFNRVSVRPNSININFELQKHGVEMEKNDMDVFPYPANKINDFFLSFKVFNPHDKEIKILRSISIDPVSEVEIVVNLNKAEIRPFAKPITANGNKATTWNLIPLNNSIWEVKVKKIFPYLEYRDYSFKDIGLIHGRSKFIPYLVSDRYSIRSINSPTYQDFKEIATPYLSSINRDTIKKDLETWYGAVLARQFGLMVKDVSALIDFLGNKIFWDEQGKPASLFQRFTKDPSFRKSFYIRSHFDSKTSEILDLFFDSSRNEKAITLEQLETMLEVWQKVLEDIKDTVKIEFIWKKNPTIGHSPIDDNSPFPSVSFEFEQKISWSKNIVFPFKGEWDKNSKCYKKVGDSSDSQNGDTVGMCSQNNGNNANFDFTDKLKNLKVLFLPLKNALASAGAPAGIDIFETLIPDASDFLSWDKWEIKKDEYVIVNYKAKDSPIRPSLTNNFDTRDNLSPNVVLGWKAMDVSVSYDLQNFHQFFYRIYEKIDTKRVDGKNITTFSLANIPSDVKTKPITFIAHYVNEIFKNSKNRPWQVFFKSLLEKPFTFSSVQVFAGYSRAFFEVDEWVLQGTKESTKSTYKTSFDWENNGKPLAANSFLAKPKYSDIKNIIETFYIYYSTFFPRPPMVFRLDEDAKYKQFMNKEGATTIGLTKNIDKLKTILQYNYHSSFKDGKLNDFSKSFPIKSFVNWNRVKLSFVQFEIQKALKSVLSLQNDISSGLLGALISGAAALSIPRFLGEALQRDGFLINVNMMMEDGSVVFYTYPRPTSVINQYSMHQWFVTPSLDPKKFEWGNLKSILNLS